MPEVPSREERIWAMLCHLSSFLGYIFPIVGHILGPLAVWLIKREDSPFIDDQGKESLNFQISMIIYSIIAFLLTFIFIGFFLVVGLMIFEFIVVIVAVVNANSGKRFRYPFTIRFIKTEFSPA